MELHYINSEGQKLDFTRPPYFARDITELLDYDWEYAMRGNKITGFSKQPAEIPITINILAETKEEYEDACNYLFEVLEKDILKNVKGKLYYNGQYVSCNLTGSKKKDWCMGVCFQLNYLRLITDKPMWIKETEYNFKTADITSTNNKRYGYRYGYRYANGLKDTAIMNEHFDSVHFKLRIYGPCVNPLVNIGGHSYTVHTILEDGEYLEIDSMKRTVIKTMMNGSQVNLFHYRGKDVFAKILPGRQPISWDGKFDFDIILFEERSEPKWG